MAIMLPTARRKDGEEQPYIPLGIFKLRLPFVHWGVEISEVLQAMVMFVSGMGAIAALQDVFGMSFEVALTIVCFHELTYCLHQILGDPVIPGWISPALPLMVTFITSFSSMGDRIHALIATQLMVGVLFFILGITGVAQKLLNIVPKPLQAGIILGAGISAIIGKYCFSPTGTGFNSYPFSITVGGLFALYMLYSSGFHEKVADNPGSFFAKVANYGIMPGVGVGIIVGWIVGEIPLPQFQPGLFFIPHVSTVFKTYSIFGAGIPPLEIWLKVLPMAVVAYIIAFGDMIIGRTVVQEANTFRPDEKIDCDANRLNLLCAIRNFLEGCFAPTITLAGPLWAAMAISVSERYKLGRKAMDSIFGGAGSFNIMKFLSCLILPLVCIFKPALPVALSLTLMIQGFACTYIAMRMAKSDSDLGIAGITGGALAVGGPAMGLAVGLALCFVIQGKETIASIKNGCSGKNAEESCSESV